MSPCNLHGSPTATATALVKDNQNFSGSLLQEVALEVFPWSTTGIDRVIYGMFLEEITHTWNICAIGQGLFVILEHSVIYS